MGVPLMEQRDGRDGHGAGAEARRYSRAADAIAEGGAGVGSQVVAAGARAPLARIQMAGEQTLQGHQGVRLHGPHTDHSVVICTYMLQ